jgi:hypothetical protein
MSVEPTDPGEEQSSSPAAESRAPGAAARGKQRPPWRWRVADRAQNPRLNLLYEPGNWGDILKGSWAAVIARELVRRRGLERLLYLDPFAGAPTYPLVDAARARLAALPPGLFGEIQAGFSGAGELASTALVVRGAAARAGAGVDLRVFDADPARAEAWRAVPEAIVLACREGGEALGDARGGDTAPDFILVDPYDLLDSWPGLLPGAIEAARRAPLLLYLHNKSPRSAGQGEKYAAFRRALAAGLGAGSPRLRALLGRLPSDASLARAYHEVLLLVPGETSGGGAGPGALRAELRDLTRALARHLTEAGAFEELGPETR